MVQVCSTCGRTVHAWRGGWRHSRGFQGQEPVDHAVTGPIGPGEWVARDPERDALRRALGYA